MIDEKQNGNQGIELVFLLAFAFLFSIFISATSIAAPVGPDTLTYTNETNVPASAYQLNVSGGYIATINIGATVQNPRWKAFVGNVSGTFTLDDATGATIFDWSLTSIGGEIYATRNASTVSWTAIRCVNTSLLEIENGLMSHTSTDDNISKTFNGTTHAGFFVGAVNISVNTCPTLNTYKNSAAQDVDFEEVALSDSTNFASGGKIIYATILEQDVSGFDNNSYDFQMIVPENGGAGFSGITPYYLYVELS